MTKAHDRIGPYELIRKLGEGGFGEVWLAQDFSGSNAREVTLKIPLRSEIDLDVLLQEAASWMRVPGHPNVLEFIATRVFDGQIVMVSEYAPGGSLENWLRRSGGRAPSVEAAVELTLGILEGLEHLHNRGVIHRDLKPDNVMLAGETPRLADFGVSRALKSTGQSAAAAGAAPYLAPEAINRNRNQQTDLWSVGVMLYQMLSGRLPFNGADPTELHDAVCSKKPEPLHATPVWLQEAVAKSLIKEPEQRYQTTAAMRAALTLQPPVIEVDPAPPLYRTAAVDETQIRNEPTFTVAVIETSPPDNPSLTKAVDEKPLPGMPIHREVVDEIPLLDEPNPAVTPAVTVDEIPLRHEPDSRLAIDEISLRHEPDSRLAIDEISFLHEPNNWVTVDEIQIRHEPNNRVAVDETSIQHEPNNRIAVDETSIQHDPNNRGVVDETLIQYEPNNRISVGELMLRREPSVITPQPPRPEPRDDVSTRPKPVPTAPQKPVSTARQKPVSTAPRKPVSTAPQNRRPGRLLIGVVTIAVIIALVIALAVYLMTRSGKSPVPATNSSPTIAGQTFTEVLNGVKLEMIGAPAGSFQMGAPENEPWRTSAEVPQHRVNIKAFSIGKYEVTQAQWKAVMDGGNPSKYKGDDLPVENVSWNDAKEFCQKLSQLTGKPYGLPSEAEWEYASRSKTKGTYPSHLIGMAWYSGNSRGKTQPVGRKLPNAFELYDMHGNVWEWCEDIWHRSYGGQGDNPPNDGRAWMTGGERNFRALRGGSWNNDLQGVRSAFRVRGAPGARGPHIGFRVVVSSKSQ